MCVYVCVCVCVCVSVSVCVSVCYHVCRLCVNDCGIKGQRETRGRPGGRER